MNWIQAGLGCLALSIGTTFPILAQVTWQPIAGNSGPKALTPAMVYDSHRKTYVLVSGLDTTGTRLGVHELRATTMTWIPKHTRLMPPMRMGHHLAFDESRGKTVLFGGQDTKQLNDTWEWDGENWQQVTTPVAPRSRSGASMCYSPTRKSCILFGGYNYSPSQGGVLLGDLWEYRHGVWTQLSPPAVGPEARQSAAICSERDRDVIHLYGGYGWGRALADHWLLLGGNWLQAANPAQPGVRTGATMCFDHVRQRVVLVAGARGPSPPSIYLDDVWELDSRITLTQWVRRDPVLTFQPRCGAALAAGGDGAPPVLFSGGPQWATETFAYRRGCESVRAAIPETGSSVSLRCVTEPAIGKRWCLGVDASSTRGSILYVASARACSGGVMIGNGLCSPSHLYVTTLDLVALGSAAQCVDIPDSASLLGTKLCVQSLALHTTPCLLLSNGIDVVVHR